MFFLHFHLIYPRDFEEVFALVLKYHSTTLVNDFDKQRAFDVLKMDKKRERKEMNYVLLEKVGKGIVQSIPLVRLEKIIQGLPS